MSLLVLPSSALKHEEEEKRNITSCNILIKLVVKNSGNKEVFSRLFDMRCLCHPVSISYSGRDI